MSARGRCSSRGCGSVFGPSSGDVSNSVARKQKPSAIASHHIASQPSARKVQLIARQIPNIAHPGTGHGHIEPQSETLASPEPTRAGWQGARNPGLAWRRAAQ